MHAPTCHRTISRITTAAITGLGVSAAVMLDASLIAAPGDESATPAPLPDQSAIHATLHDLYAVCPPDPAPGGRPALDRDTAAILAFAQKYPHAWLDIDGDEYRTSGLLVLARDALKTCYPQAASVMNNALPPNLRIPQDDGGP